MYISPLLCSRSDYTVLVRRVGFMLTNVKNAHIEALNHAQTLSGKTKTRNLRVISESCASTKCSNPNVWRSLFVGHAEFSSIHLRAAAINYLSAS